MKKVKETYSETYTSQSNPLNVPAVKELIDKNQISGYVQRAGKLEDGNSFSVVYIIIKEITCT